MLKASINDLFRGTVLMNTLRKIVLVLTFAVIMIAAAVPAFAQNAVTTSVTLTEDQINEAYRVSNSPRRSVSDVVVDLQPSQVVVSATVTLPRQSPVTTVTVLVPSLTNGRLTWTVDSITANGQPASGDLVTQVNAAIASSWRSYFRRQLPAGRLTGVTITDNDVTITLTGR